MAAPQDDASTLAPRPALASDVTSDAMAARAVSIPGHPPSVDQLPAPTVDYVAQVFIVKYYEVFCKRPEHLFRFYKDESVYSHSSGPDESSSKHCVTGLRSINEIITSHGMQRYLSKISSIDSQEAPEGSVMISVTGTLTSQLGLPVARHFSQAFLLCPQENGYFVRNDVFRFLDPAPAEAGIPEPATEPQDTSVADAAKEEQTKESIPVGNGIQSRIHVDDTTISVVSEAPAEEAAVADGPALELEKQDERIGDQVTEAASTMSPATDQPQSEDIGALDIGPTPEDSALAAPKSWASLFDGRIRDDKASADAQEGAASSVGADVEKPSPQASQPVAPEAPEEQVSAPRNASGPNHSQSDHRPNEQNVVTVPPSVWVSQLPTNVQLPELDIMMRVEFAKYGKVKNVDCRVQRGFAFVDMDSWDSVGIAVDAWANQPAPISGPFKGVKLNVQIRKQPPLKGPGRGGITRSHSSGRGGGNMTTRGGRGGGNVIPEDRRTTSTTRSGRVARTPNGAAAAPKGEGANQRGGKGRSQGTE